MAAALPETTTAGGSSAGGAWLARITRLSVVIILAFVALAALTARADAGGQITVLAADDGLQLLGPLAALPEATPKLHDLSPIAISASPARGRGVCRSNPSGAMQRYQSSAGISTPGLAQSRCRTPW